MVNKDILDFIHAQDMQGVSRFTIRHALISQGGWSVGNIEEAFAMVPLPASGAREPQQTYTPEMPPQAVVTEVHQSSGKGKIVFLTVLCTLFISALLVLLAFAFIPEVREFLIQCVA